VDGHEEAGAEAEDTVRLEDGIIVGVGEVPGDRDFGIAIEISTEPVEVEPEGLDRAELEALEEETEFGRKTV